MYVGKKWWESTAIKPHGNPVKNLLALRDRIIEMEFWPIEKTVIRCTADYVPYTRRLLREAGWNVQVIAYRVSHKRPRCTYKTIKRDCAKRNR